jgi:hypothetical protein
VPASDSEDPVSAFDDASAFVVFAQARAKGALAPPTHDAAANEGPPLDVEEWNGHAVRFFRTRLGLAQPLARLPVGIVVAPEGQEPGVRRVAARPREARDLALVAKADAGNGLARLVRRCNAVWLVERTAEADALALRLSIILASLALGPVLDPRTLSLFGVKTGREKLEALFKQYR